MKCLDSRYAVRNPELKAFKRVSLAAGERKTVELETAKRAFTVIDDNGRRVTEGKKFAVYASCSQPDERSCELTGHAPAELFYSIG